MAGPEDWANTALAGLLELSGKGKKWAALLKHGRAGVAYLTFGEKPRLGLAVQCADAATGEQLRAYFQGHTTADASTGGADTWATFTAAVDPRSGVALLKRFLDDAGK